MACPTCSHTMSAIDKKLWWCPRCGTLKSDQLRLEKGVVTETMVIGLLRGIQEAPDMDAVHDILSHIQTDIKLATQAQGERP